MKQCLYILIPATMFLIMYSVHMTLISFRLTRFCILFSERNLVLNHRWHSLFLRQLSQDLRPFSKIRKSGLNHLSRSCSMTLNRDYSLIRNCFSVNTLNGRVKLPYFAKAMSKYFNHNLLDVDSLLSVSGKLLDAGCKPSGVKGTCH